MKRSELGRQLQALRKTRAGGRPVGSRKVQHVRGVPIGSRETVKGKDGRVRYRCSCLECRKARGQYPARPKTPKK